MASTRVAVDVGGTFTDICVLDEASGAVSVAKVPSTSDPMEGVLAGVEEAGIDLRDVVVFSHGTTVATNALLTRRLPAGRDGDDGRLPGHHRDPPRHQGRPLGRVQGRLRAVHPPSRSARGAGADRLRGRDPRAARRGRGSQSRRHSPRARGLHGGRVLHQLLRQSGQRAPDEGNPARGAARRDGVDVERHPAGDLRARALLDDSRERRPVAARGGLHAPAGPASEGVRLRRRSAAAPFGRRRDDASRGRAAGRPPRRLGDRCRRHRGAPHRDPVRPSRTRSDSTWAGRAPISRSSTTESSG